MCVEDLGEVDASGWICGEPLAIDCSTQEVPAEIFVVLDPGACGAADLLQIDGPFFPGIYDVEVVDDATGDALCVSELAVTDSLPPVVTTAEIELWPPNHKYHPVDLADCMVAVDDCDPSWEARLLWVSSDEPDDDVGDGNTSADIVVTSPTSVELRSERQGGRNGRVYTLGWEIEDGSGNLAEGVCLVTVPHDRGAKGAAIDDGEAYRIELE